ncbi:hypothetical protein EC991_008479 [Linnemannia zychae]|nr:hypothetical protein EC991_008479 [Linnemannia zychae]
MRILSISLGLTAIVFVSAQVAASDSQNNYKWGPVQDKDLAAQVEDLSSQVSEIEFRSHILSRLQQEASVNFKTEGTCDDALSVIQTSLSTINRLASVVSSDPFVASVMRHVVQTNELLNRLVTDSASTSITGPAFASISLASDSIISVLQGVVSLTDLTAKPVILKTLKTLRGSIAILGQCLAEGSKLSIDPSSCYALADIYRAVIQDAAGSNPALNLPANAQEDLKRIASGSLTILDLISKSSIAATNEALLSSRPIFAADILDQYRTELIRVTTDEEIKGYAVAALGTVVGVSNSLEACLRVTADPVEAIDELNMELEAQAIYDEEEENEE